MHRVLVTGASGFLGVSACNFLHGLGFHIIQACRSRPDRLPRYESRCEHVCFDLASHRDTTHAVHDANPDAVVHLGAMCELAACEANPERAHAVNVQGTRAIAEWCRQADSPVIFASTDQVFDGERGLYREQDCMMPCHVYGETKRDAEALLTSTLERSVALRIALVYGSSPTGTRSASEQIVRAFQNGTSPCLFTDEIRTPVFIEDVARVIGELLGRMLVGDQLGLHSPLRTLHLAGPDPMSRYEFGQHVASAFGYDAMKLTAMRHTDLALPVRRPRDVSLNTALARSLLRTRLHGVREGLAAHAAEAKSAKSHSAMSGS